MIISKDIISGIIQDVLFRFSIINKQKPEEIFDVIRQPTGPDGTNGFKIRR